MLILILDGTDNFQIRYLINDACVKLEQTLDLRRGGFELWNDDDDHSERNAVFALYF